MRHSKVRRASDNRGQRSFHEQGVLPIREVNEMRQPHPRKVRRARVMKAKVADYVS
ncbi:MAG: hypothetical protein DIU61_015750 [Bacteroidota bacterium]